LNFLISLQVNHHDLQLTRIQVAAAAAAVSGGFAAAAQNSLYITNRLVQLAKGWVARPQDFPDFIIYDFRG